MVPVCWAKLRLRGGENGILYTKIAIVVREDLATCRYLNNMVEQAHRAIKRRCASTAGFKSFDNAAITIAGLELAHRIHKRQFSFGAGRPRRTRSLKVLQDRAFA